MVDILEFLVDITLKWLIFHPNLSELVLAMRERKHPHVHAETSACIGKKILHADPPHFHAHEKTSAWQALFGSFLLAFIGCLGIF